MKKAILMLAIIGLTSVCANLFAQTVSTGKVWTMYLESSTPPEYGGVNYYRESLLQGDTIIDNMKYIQCYERTRAENEELFNDWKAKNVYYCQQDGKIYQKSGNSKPRVTIDYSLQVGDSIKGDLFQYIVTAVSDTVFASSTDKTPRKCLYITDKWRMIIEDVWVEGIGSLTYGLEGLAVMEMAGFRRSLEKCQEGDKILYQRKMQNSSPYDLDGDGVLTLNDITTLINVYLEMSR